MDDDHQLPALSFRHQLWLGLIGCTPGLTHSSCLTLPVVGAHFHLDPGSSWPSLLQLLSTLKRFTSSPRGSLMVAYNRWTDNVQIDRS